MSIGASRDFARTVKRKSRGQSEMSGISGFKQHPIRWTGTLTLFCGEVEETFASRPANL